MNKLYISICLCFSLSLSYCQSAKKTAGFNLGFEKISPDQKLPDDWIKWGSGYDLIIDTLVRKSGKISMLIQPSGEKSANTFGCIAHAIPAMYAGKEIEVRAYMKLINVADGVIGLMLRIDGESGPLGFENMMDKKIEGTSDWKLYSVKLPYPENAKNIYIGALLSGTGQLWVDDFQVLIDGKDPLYAKVKKGTEYKAVHDKEFDKGSGIASITLSESKIQDLVLLGKIWGFIKYYHPAVADGEYNWDYELFRILPKFLEAKTMTERNSVLYKWISQLGKIKDSNDNKLNTDTIKILPDLAWIDSPDIEDKLKSKLNEIRLAKRTESHYYIGLVPGVGNPVFKNENRYADMIYPDAGFRLLSLYRYWNIIQYYFPDKHLIGENWNNVLKEFIPKYLAASDTLDYKLTVLSLIARVHDTHANIWGRDDVLSNYKGINYAPLEVSFIENKAVVTDYFDQDLGEKSGLKKGDIIEAVDNRRVDEIINEKLQYTPASNYPTQLREIANDLLRTNDSLLTIVYNHDGVSSPKQIECFGSRKINPYMKYQKRDTCFKLITPDIAYIYPGTIKNDYLPAIMPEVLKTKGLIIDFRSYPSDFIVFSLGKYLLSEPRSFVKFSNGSITTPGLFTMQKELKVGEKNEDYYKGKVVIIVNETTQSSAEYHTMAFRTVPGAMVIGSTTAGADGNVSQFYLPGGISTMISGIGVYYPDGKETQRIGIVPDIEIKPTIKGIKEGRDELLEKAIEIINEAKG
ncbi:MAG: S41 family peptidase [Saprospiraceae bacterium]